MRITKGFLVAILIYTTRFSEGITDPPVIVYEHWKFGGKQFAISDLTECVNLPVDMRNQATSIETPRKTCVRLHDRQDCRGESIEISSSFPSNDNLDAWGFGDKAVSIGPCRNNCDVGVTGEKPIAPIQIKIFSEDDFQGNSLVLDVFKCTKVPEEFASKVRSVITSGKCIELFEDDQCSLPESRELRPEAPFQGSIKAKWKFPIVKSIGHCSLKCSDEKGFGGGISQGNFLHVTFYFHVNKQGPDFHVNIQECANLPRVIQRSFSSVDLHGNCARLHSDEDCKGSSVELYPGSPSGDYLGDWGFHDKTESVGPCRSSCDPEVAGVFPKGHIEVQVFTEENQAGRSKFLQVNGCTVIPTEFRDQIKSIVTLGNCIQLYDNNNCDPNQSIELRKSAPFHDKLTTRWHFYKIKSISHCAYKCLENDTKLFVEAESGSASTTNSSETQNSTLSTPVLIIIVIVTLLCVLVLAMILVWYTRRKYFRPHTELTETLLESEIREFKMGLGMDIEGSPEAGETASEYSVEILAQNKPYNVDYEVKRSDLKFDSRRPLGVGEFGMVFKGLLDLATVSRFRSEGYQNFAQPPEPEVAVAVKTTKPNSDVRYLRTFLKEVKVMMYIGEHPHITCLLGCCTENLREGEIYVIMEYCSKGSLEVFLQKNRASFRNVVEKGILLPRLMEDNWRAETGAFDIRQLVLWSMGISNGMEYLASKKVIHGDLATRNILLNERFEVKISDFGLSKQLYCYTEYVKRHQEPLPWRWLAPESMRQLEFSSKSDVWSFGILVWEIFTLGEKPYPGVTWNDDFIRNVDEGMRLAKPKYSTTAVYNLMLGCWNLEPVERPPFSEIYSDIHLIFQEIMAHSQR